jgi:hypothetical protein
MYKKSHGIGIVSVLLVASVSTSYAQRSGLPPISEKTAKKPSVAQPSVVPAGDLPPAEKSNPIETKMFPYAEDPLRDPFWKVGYFPAEWGMKREIENQEVSASAWRIPTSQIEISGVSRMGARVMAIINGELKQVGDVVQIFYLGKIFQWKIREIQADGNVSFDRYKIINDTPANRSTL